MDISEINECFKNGYIHNSLFYSIEDKISIDPRKINYTNYYQSYDFFENKFSSECYSIPGFDKLIENMSNVAIVNNKTPLKELEERIIYDESNNKFSSER